MNHDLYDILGIGPAASEPEIKTAWRQFSKVHHPDKGGDKETFQRGQHAFEILSDPVKRRIYDETGDSNFAHNRQVEMERGILDVINAVIQEQGETVNLIEASKERFRRSRMQFIQQGASAETQLQRFEKLKSRIRFRPVNGSERNIIADFFESRIAGCRQGIQAAAQSVKMVDDCIDLLQAWEDAGGPESLSWPPAYGGMGATIAYSQL